MSGKKPQGVSGVKKVLVVDDHDLIRLGICRLLSEVVNVTVVGQASSGEQAIQMTRETAPDIVFMDIRMPGIGGIEATRRILAANDNIKVIVVSAFSEDIYPSLLIKAGASGYITKKADAGEISDAIDSVSRGQIYISPSLAQDMVSNQLNKGKSQSPFTALSEREIQVAEMITSGKRANDIATTLNVSPKTVNTYKYRIYDKVGVDNDVQLTLAAVRSGLVDPFQID